LAGALAIEVEELSEDSGQQLVSLTHRAKTNRRLAFISIAGGLLDVVLTVVIAFALAGMNSNTHRIDALTQRLDTAQTVQRQKALCPLYQVFLDSKSDKARAAAPDPAKYDHAFVVIKAGYKALECDAFITGSP
jgi:hypothetical protein